jgi:mannosyl-3-phosphoglycerate phosphatase family protein
MGSAGTSLTQVDERTSTEGRDQAPSVVVFSRLDPAVLEDSAHARATLRGGLERLAARGIPVVVGSRATRAEVELLRDELGLTDPFVAENGAAVFVPRGYFPFPLPASGLRSGYHTFERSIAHDAVVRALRRAASQARVSVAGFSDMSISEVARETGLTLLQARLAKLREYDEPFRVIDPEAAARARLLKTLRGAGLQVWSEGRFDHVVGSADMGACVALLRGLYARRRPVVTIGVGAADADLDFLKRVDVPVMVPAGARRGPVAVARSMPGARIARSPGPEAWVDAVEEAVYFSTSPASASTSR